MTLPAGTHLGPGEMTPPIGVALATSGRLEPTVAVTVIPSTVAADPERRGRLTVASGQAGFALHRPRFHGKACTSIVVEGLLGGKACREVSASTAGSSPTTTTRRSSGAAG